LRKACCRNTIDHISYISEEKRSFQLLKHDRPSEKSAAGLTL
jgi:hypothetical protein